MAGRERLGMAALAQAGDGDFSVIGAIGGVRGVVESILPGLVFVVLFMATSDLRLTIVASAVLAAVQVLVRLALRQSAMGALGGLVAVVVCLVWAWRSHDARDYYMLGFVTNTVYLGLLSVSLLLRTPGVGLLVEFVRTMPTSRFAAWLKGWRDDEPLRRAYAAATALWIGVFALRLAVQVPLYAADRVGWLGTARLAMGLPFWALAIWVSYLLVATPLHRHRLAERG